MTPIFNVLSNDLNTLMQGGLNKHAKLLKLHKEAVMKEYPVTTDDEVLDIIFAKERQRDCQKCRTEGRQVCILVNEMESVISKEGAVSLVPCKKRQREKLLEACKISKIPKRYQLLTMNDYIKDRHNFSAVTAATAAISEGGGLFIHGSTGTGKTMLASILAQEILAGGKSVYFTTLIELMITIDTLQKYELQDFLSRLSTVSYLVIDDLGAEGPSDRLDAFLFLIINNRYNNNRPLIVTTNLDGAEIGVSLTRERVLSRLRGECKEVTLNGPDRRTIV